jgi:hypothetical protein
VICVHRLCPKDSDDVSSPCLSHCEDVVSHRCMQKVSSECVADTHLLILIAGETVNVLTLWTAALLLKAFVQSLAQETECLSQVFSQGFVKRIIRLATLATNMSQFWMLPDLEVSTARFINIPLNFECRDLIHVRRCKSVTWD